MHYRYKIQCLTCNMFYLTSVSRVWVAYVNMSQSFKIQWVQRPATTLSNDRARNLILGNVGQKVHIMKKTNVIHAVVTIKVMLRLRLIQKSKPACGGTLAFYPEEVEWLFNVLKQRKPGWLQRQEKSRNIEVEFPYGGVRISLKTATNEANIWLPLAGMYNLIIKMEEDYLPLLKAICNDANLPAALTADDMYYSG